MDKKCNVQGMAMTAIYSIIGLVVLFLIVANLYPTLAQAGNNLSTSGLPLWSLFASGGLIFILIAVGLLITVVALVMPKGKKR